MSSNPHIIDIRGFQVEHDSPFVASFLDSAFGERDIGELDDIDDGEIRKMVQGVYHYLRGMQGIDVRIHDPVNGSGPLAIGWHDFDLATPEKLSELQGVLEKAGFTVQRLIKDRFITYL